MRYRPQRRCHAGCKASRAASRIRIVRPQQSQPLRGCRRSSGDRGRQHVREAVDAGSAVTQGRTCAWSGFDDRIRVPACFRPALGLATEHESASRGALAGVRPSSGSGPDESHTSVGGRVDGARALLSDWRDQRRLPQPSCGASKLAPQTSLDVDSRKERPRHVAVPAKSAMCPLRRSRVANACAHARFRCSAVSGALTRAPAATANA